MTKKLNKYTTIAWMVGVSASILFACSSLRHALFQSTALDLAVFDQWIYLASIDVSPISSLLGFHLVGDHAAFILYAVALLYKIIPNVHWLFAIQAIALSAGALPIYALSLQTGLSPIYTRAVAFSYLLYPALFNSNFYTDFRPEAIAVPALLWAMWAGLAGKTRQLIAAVVLILSCKEILSLTVIALGIWLWLVARKRLYGWGCAIAGIVWFAATVGYLVPMLRKGEAGGVVFYASLGNSPSEILSNILTNPSLILSKFFLSETIFYYLLLLLPVIIGLHWQQIMTILPALPMLLLNILSDYSAQRDLIHHYSLPIFPFIIVWLLRSLQQYIKQKKRLWLSPKLLIIWTLISFFALAKYEYFITRYLTNINRINSLNTAVNLVKTQESVLTTGKIAPHLSHRQIIKIIDNNPFNFEINNESFKYILLDSQEELDNVSIINQLQVNQEYHLLYESDNVYLFVKI